MSTRKTRQNAGKLTQDSLPENAMILWTSRIPSNKKCRELKS